MHPEKNRPLWVVHHLRAVQGDISLPGTHVAPRGPGHAKEHWMAKVAPAFNFGWGKVDDILNHCFNPIPIGRPDKSAQGWACLIRWWVPMIDDGSLNELP